MTVTGTGLAIDSVMTDKRTHYLRKFKHDCDTCRFLGTVEGPHPRMAVKNPPHVAADLWYCERAELGGSVIARYSDEGSDYSSCPITLLSKDSNPMLLWANALLEMEKLC